MQRMLNPNIPRASVGDHDLRHGGSITPDLDRLAGADVPEGEGAAVSEVDGGRRLESSPTAGGSGPGQVQVDAAPAVTA
jgi:aspartate 1-decarboxylase